VSNQCTSHPIPDQCIERLGGMNVKELFELRSIMVQEIKELSGNETYNEIVSSSKRWFNAIENVLMDLERYPLINTDNSVETNDQKMSVNSLSIFQEEYLKYVRTNMAKKTYDNAQRVLKQFGNFIGNKPLNKIGARDLEQYKEERKKSVKIATVNMDVRTLKAAFQIAVNWEWIEKNPFEKVKEIRSPKKDPRPLTREEYDKLCIEMKDDWLLDIVKFAILTGLRLGEIINLKWKNIDFERKLINVASSDEYQVKHGKPRPLPLNSGALEILNGLSKDTEWVFTDAKGKKYNGNTVSKKFKKYIRRCKMSDELHFHSLRTTFTSWGISNGIPMYAMKTFLGHSSVKTTEGYSAFDDNGLREAIEKVSINNDSDLTKSV